jgi:hypothetical protein
VIEYLIANGCPRHHNGTNEENNIDNENVLNDIKYLVLVGDDNGALDGNGPDRDDNIEL